MIADSDLRAGAGWAGIPIPEALQSATTAIEASGCDTPRLDAEVLLADVLGVDRARLLSDRELTVAGPAVRAFQDAVRRRAFEREPVAYITGRRGFRALELHVDRRALIPRPETELLVEAALTLPAGARVLDVGTGSGAVALALAHERPDLEVSGSDVDADTLALARANGERLGLAVRWLRADLLDGIEGEFDAVLSNPPYVAESERATLAPEIVRHEPARALFAGADGLDAIRALLAQLAVPRWRAVRTVALEVGAGQAAAVGELMRGADFPGVQIERDLAGIERVVVGERMRGGGWEGEGVSDRDPRALSRGAQLDSAAAERFAACIRAGGVVLFPADTVYGLACDPCNAGAVRRLYELKGRPRARPAAVMFFALRPALAALPELGPRARAVLRALLPGPLTILLPNPAERFPLACDPTAALTGSTRAPAGEESAPVGEPAGPLRGAGGAGTLGLRVPLLGDRLTALAAIEQPVLQSSANFSGGPEARRVEDVDPSLRAAADMVLDGGELPGVASTVLDLRSYEADGHWRIVREGPASAAELAAVLDG